MHNTTFEVADLMRLVDAYAETRHTCGDAHYNAKSKEARDAVRAALVSAIQPQTTYATPSPNLAVAPSGPGTSAAAPKAAPASAAVAWPSEVRPYRTDAEIVDQTVALTKYLLDWKWGLAPEGDASRIWESGNTKAQVCWNAACHIQDLLTQTDVWNAVANIEGEEAAPTTQAAPAPAAQGDALDAARYRWLRARWGRIADEYDGDSDQLVAIRESDSHFEGWDVDPVSLDRAIDAARGAKGESE